MKRSILTLAAVADSMRPALAALLASFATAALVLGATALAGPSNDNRTEQLTKLGHLTRACTPATGAPVKLAATTSSDADSGALDTYTNYRIDCDTDAWVDFADSASDAVADDTKIRAAVPEVFYTGADRIHWSALSVDVDGDCRLTKCQ